MKISATRRLLTSLALACVLSTRGSSDIIVLKNGNEIQGEVLRADDRQIVVRFSGGILRLRLKDVKEIRRQDRDVYLLEEGDKQLRRGEYAAAVKSYAEASRAKPESLRAKKGLVAAQLLLATSLREIGRFREARDVLKELRASGLGLDEVKRELNVLEETLREARRQEENAVARLERGDVDGALGRLQKLYDRFPDRRKEIGRHLADALVKKGDHESLERDWANAAKRYLTAITVRPELLPEVRPRFVTATLNRLPSLLEKGDFVALETLAREGLEVAPTSEPLRYYYGLSQEGQGRARAAAEEYLAITGERRPSNLERSVGELRLRAKNMLLETAQVQRTAHPDAARVLSGEFRTTESRRFRIRHKNSKIAREVMAVSERIYNKLYRQLGCSTHLIAKILVTMHPTREEYLETAADIVSWSGGSHRVQRMGVLSQHEITCYQDQPGLLTETIPHEIAHSLLAHRLNYPDGGIPLWANEGFAIVVEPNYVHRHYRRLVAQEMARRNLSKVDDLTQRLTYPDDNVSLFYAQSFSLVEFLVGQKDLETFVRLVQSVSSSGMSLDAALLRHYKFQGVTALESRWRAWLERR